MKRAIVTALLLAALLAIPPAAAKGRMELTVCGASDCRTFVTTHPDWRHANLTAGVIETRSSVNFTTAPPVAPYFRLDLVVEGVDGDRMRAFYVPGRRVMNDGYSWRRVSPRFASSFAAATGSLAPWPSPTIERVVVGGRRASTARPYTALFGPLEASDAPAGGRRSLEIVLRAGEPSPWTDGLTPLRYFPRMRVVQRDTEWLRVPDVLADRIERDAGLTEAIRVRSRWPGYVSLAALLAAGVATIWLTFSRRRLQARAS